MPPDTPDTPNTTSANAPTRRRQRMLLALGGAFAAAGIAYAANWALVARHLEKTDDAYVAGNVVQITPRTAGTVLAIHADDTDFVRSGEPLVELDPADAKIALEHAQAQLAQTVREVRTLFATSNALSATIRLREADVGRAHDDLARRQALAGSGAVSAEEIAHARTALAAAEATLAAAREQFASNHALIDNATVEQHPRVLAAAAQVREAWLAHERSTIPAPVSGYVAKRGVQVGQRIAPGAPLMAVIPLDQVWVDANFKEGQLQHMRIGQPVTLKSDIYGSSVEYHGKVTGLSAGTGAAFALLPAQNATGNWIKVVQRVPVRIALDPSELAEHPLRVGLSMQVDVDVRDQSGKQLAEARSRREPVASTDAFSDDSTGADALVRQIIATHLRSAPASGLPALAHHRQPAAVALAGHASSEQARFH